MADDEEIRPEDVEVHLKPVLGLEPTTWVPIAWGLLIVLVLFLVFIAPGLRYNGTHYLVISTPRDASVVVDGVRLGSTPGDFFVEHGERSIEVRRPGFQTSTQTVNVRGRVLGSWMFPRRTTLHVVLSGADPDALANATITSLSQWALAGEASGQYQFPPLARQLAADLKAGTSGVSQAQDTWTRFLAQSVPQIASEAIAGDIVSGTLALGGASGVAVPNGIAYAAQRLADLADRAPLLAAQVDAFLSTDRKGALDSGSWLAASSAYASGITGMAATGAIGGTTSFPLGLKFASFGPGSATLGGDSRASRGGDVPYRADVGSFQLETTEVPFAAYQSFIDANPEWAVAGADALVAKGVVDDSYLTTISAMSADPQLPVTGVSAYAAQAFADWYDTLLPASLEARLPTEAEWEYALALSGGNTGVFSTDGRTGPVDVAQAGAGGPLTGMLGNVWEWTQSGYARYGNAYPAGTISAKLAPQRVVLGGGWGNDALSFRAAERGALDPAWCSPYVGFRLVISPAK